MVNTFILRVNLHVDILKYVDSPFRTDIVRNALKTRTVLIPEKFATFGENVTYLDKKNLNCQTDEQTLFCYFRKTQNSNSSPRV